MNDDPRSEAEWKMLDELAIRQDMEQWILDCFIVGIAIGSLFAVLMLGDLLNSETVNTSPQPTRIWHPNEVDYFEWGFRTEQERWRRLEQLEGKP